MIGKCSLCEVETELTLHHLVPKLKAKKKYKDIRDDESNHIMICRQCHDQIHQLYDESWLRDNLNTLDKLKSDEKMMKFVEWRKKHPEYTGHSKMSNNRRDK